MLHHLGGALAAAQYAAFWAAISLVLLCAIISYIACSWGGNSNKFWIRATFVAELCSAIGMVGLLTFVGRAYIEDYKRDVISNVVKAEAEASEALSAIGRTFCLDPLRPPRLFVGGGHSTRICKVWRESIIYDPKVNWGQVIEIFIAFGHAKDSDPLMRPAVYVASEKIKAMQQARQARDFEEAWGEALRPKTSWAFVLFAAFLVGLGISIKCAKAWSELVGRRSLPATAFPR